MLWLKYLFNKYKKEKWKGSTNVNFKMKTKEIKLFVLFRNKTSAKNEIVGKQK